MKDILIKVEKLSKSFGTNNVLEDISFNIHKNEKFVVIGRSGTGKSVLLKTMMGLIPADSGKVIISGKNIVGKSMDSINRYNLGMGMLFQNSALFDSLSVEDNVVFYIKSHKNNMNKSELRDIAVENLRLVGLNEDALLKYPSDLSGGMKKRVAMARLLVMRPKILVFDEPTSGLDPVMSTTISNLINRVTDYLKATSITITHDMRSAKIIADSIMMIDNSHIRWVGPIENIDNADDEVVRKFINGEE